MKAGDRRVETAAKQEEGRRIWKRISGISDIPALAKAA